MTLPLSYNWRNLFVRKLSTALTFAVVMVVVMVLSVLLSFAAGIRASLIASGSPANLLVLKPGATAESTSVIPPNESARLGQAPGIAVDESGRPLVSLELYVQSSIPRRGPNGSVANVAVRGVTDTAFTVHDTVKLLHGRRVQQGTLEVMVGKAARERYANLDIGGEIHLGRMSNRVFKVVGVFEAGGSAFESEVWAPYTIVQDCYARRLASSVLIRLQNPSTAKQAISYINGPAVNLEAKREIDYYKELAGKSREIGTLTSVLVGIMAIGAVFAVANTMFAAVDSRRREIAMLRTIGFSRRAVVLAFTIESLLISSLACLAGLALSPCILYLYGVRQDFLSESTWTVLAYELQITPQTAGTAVLLAAFVGVAGAMAPAIKAARTDILGALRKA
jgi:putative ABC transport system permease protein